GHWTPAGAAARDEVSAHAVRRAHAATPRSDEGRRRVPARIAADGDRFSRRIDLARVHRSGEPRGDVRAISAGADVPAAGRCDGAARPLTTADPRADQRSDADLRLSAVAFPPT